MKLKQIEKKIHKFPKIADRIVYSRGQKINFLRFYCFGSFSCFTNADNNSKIAKIYEIGGMKRQWWFLIVLSSVLCVLIKSNIVIHNAHCFFISDFPFIHRDFIPSEH